MRRSYGGSIVEGLHWVEPWKPGPPGRHSDTPGPRVLSHDKGRRSFLRRPLCKRLGKRLPSAGFPILHVLQVLFGEVGLGGIVEDTSGELEHLLLFLVEVMSDQMLQLLGAGKPAR